MTATSEASSPLRTAPELSSSTDPRDWGRAAARALASLAGLASGNPGRPDPASIMDQDLVLRVSRCGGGVQLVLGLPRVSSVRSVIRAKKERDSELL